jgi:hypothetical protein
MTTGPPLFLIESRPYGCGTELHVFNALGAKIGVTQTHHGHTESPAAMVVDYLKCRGFTATETDLRFTPQVGR